jgi:type IV pilus assembly protein PilM
VLSGQSELADTSPARLAVINAAQAFVSRLHLEITRSTVNYRRQSGAEQPTALYLTGGGSLVPDLAAALADKLKITVERFDPLRKVELGAGANEARQRSAVLADLVGSAIIETDNQAKLNLLPQSIREALAFRRQQPFYVAAAAVLVLALALPAYSLHQAAEHAKTSVAAVQTQITPLSLISSTNADNLAKIDAAKKQIESIQGLVESKGNWISFFTDLQSRLVKIKDVWLDRLEVVRSDALPPTAVTDASAATDTAHTEPTLRLNLSGRLLDRANPTSKVSPESYNRVKELLNAFASSQFIIGQQDQKFNSEEPGILKFDFTLLVNPKHPL